MAVNYKVYGVGQVGESALNAADTTQKTELGKICMGRDYSTAAYGEAEFIYLPFTGTCNAGDFVNVDRRNKTTLQVSSSVFVTGHLGICMTAQVAGQFGWVMLRGVHDSANVATGAPLYSRLYLCAVNGQLTTTVIAGKGVDGVTLKVVPVSNIGTVELAWSAINGNG